MPTGPDNRTCNPESLIFCLNGSTSTLLFTIFLKSSRSPFNISVPADLLKNTGVTNDVPSFDALFDNTCSGIVSNGGNVDCSFKGLAFNSL